MFYALYKYKERIPSQAGAPFNKNEKTKISYKATLEGINVKIVEESYTSKCSFLDNERICKHGSYKGRRTKRGLFKTSFGKIINADINGAFNIIRKSEKESFDVTMLPKGRGFWWNPVRISV